MKKIYLLISFICFSIIYCEAQYVTIPDLRFRAFLMNRYPACFNGAGEMDTTCNAITTELSLTVSGITTSIDNKLNMTGIQYFDALNYLDISGNFIEPDYISSDPPFDENSLLPASLQTLICQNMGWLEFGPYIPVPDNVTYLDYSNNRGMSSPLYIHQNSNLRYLNCSGNSLYDIGSLPPGLDTLICSDQENYNWINWFKLYGLPALPSTLTYLDCSYNGILSLPALPAGLTYLDCSNTIYMPASMPAYLPLMSSLPALPVSLIHLNASNNALTSLPALPAGLQYLNVKENKFDYDDGFESLHVPGISCIPPLPASMQNLSISTNNITCLPNAVPGMIVDDPKPICNATNDPNRCYLPTIYPTPGTITGVAASQGIPSPSVIYHVSAANLQPVSGNITITVSVPFELSADNINFSASPLLVAYTGGTLLSTPVYVRLAGSAPGGVVSGTIIHSGGTAPDTTVIISGSVARMYYNTKADLGLTNPGTWSTTVDGTGPSPVSLTEAGQVFNIIDQARAHYTGVWDVSAANTKIVIGSETIPIHLTIPFDDYITAASIVDVMNNSTLTILTTIIPKLNLLEDGSTVDFAYTGTGNFDNIEVPRASYYNLKLTNGKKHLTYSVTTVRNDFMADGVSDFNGSGTLCLLNCFGTVSFINGTTFRADDDFPASYERMGLKMNGAGPVQNIISDGTTLRLLSIERDSTSACNIIVSPGTDMEFASDRGGGIFLRQPNTTLSTTGGKITLANYATGFNFNGSSAMNSNGTSFSISNQNYGDGYGSTSGQAGPGMLRFTPASTVKDFLMNLPGDYSDEDHIIFATDAVITDSLILTKGRIVLDPGLTLELAATGVVAGGNRTSFVDGPLKRTGNANLLFPVGNGFKKYAPLYMGFVSVNPGGTYTVKYTKAGFGNYTIDPATISLFPDYGISHIESWNITQASAGVVDTLVFNYTDTSSRISDPLHVRVAHFDNTDWNDIGGFTSSLNTTATGKVTVLAVSTFSPFTFSEATAGVVPVKLGSFSVKKQNTSVQINWTTEQEINSKTFIIERSTDQHKWNEITRLNAAGNSSQKINYTTTDFNPAKGVNYYRLKQIDLDGKFNYSEIRSVYFGNDVNIVLVPNPSSDKVTVYLPGNSTMASIQLFNANGQLMKMISTADGSVQINLNGFSKGVYTVKVNGKDLSEVRKLLIQ